MELFILTVKPIENKYTRTLIFFAYFCNKQIPYPVFFVKALSISCLIFENVLFSQYRNGIFFSKFVSMTKK